METQSQSYEFICFSDLAYEFNESDKKEIESKIKRRLKYNKLGNYDQETVEYLRKLRNDLFTEISKTSKSKFYHKSKSNYADLNDFDSEKMLNYYSEKYPKIEKSELAGMINFSIYLFYMR
ncbi:hypothetical protein [Chryseobacterium sp. RR2-3-20]|uniref:hypothetical protein n=1 Tax=Chryseobacterium sp. RR2-3-20 TaxID=2787626 RepID=UPI001ADFBF57|nr:hypothetical protein [Chryseobacterium sp. RR2-3-20]